jgi:hypothetical protein
MRTFRLYIVKFVESICTTLNYIRAKAKNVLSLALRAFPAVQSYFTSCYQTVRSIIDCLSLRFSKKRFSRAEVPDMSVDSLQLWNCFSYYPSVHCFSFLSGQRGKFFGKDKKEYPGTYLFTVDWGHPDSNILDIEHSEIPQEHKCAHILELNNGNYAAQPNNRILWNIPSYTTGNSIPDYKVQNTIWEVEGFDWVTEDSDNMFYKINNGTSS